MESDDLGCTEIAVLLSLQALAGRYYVFSFCVTRSVPAAPPAAPRRWLQGQCEHWG